MAVLPDACVGTKEGLDSPLNSMPCCLSLATVLYPFVSPHPQKRAIAMERLSRALADIPDRSELLPVLQPLSSFLLSLLADHNFKVAVGGMAALGDVAEEVGRPMQSQLR